MEYWKTVRRVCCLYMDLKIGTWNIRGLSTPDKQKEVRNFIVEEKLQVCVVLETHLKSKKIVKIGERIFGSWDWITNMRYCNKGCRIMLGWNNENIHVDVVHMARQSILCKVQAVKGQLKLFCTFFYAANGGTERKELWQDLEIYKRIVAVSHGC